MNINEIKDRISSINKNIESLNNTRNQNIGRRETLEKSLKEHLSQYEAKYGVKLTNENLQSEFEKVTVQKEEELTKLEKIVSLINAGDLRGANQLAGVE